MNPPVALTIAGSDSGAGAGIQADLKAFSALGVFGTTAVTAVTAQNTYEVTAVHHVPVAVVTAQIDAISGDLAPVAVKTGMLGTAEIVEAVGARAAAGGLPRLVVDPVMVSSSGRPLLADDAISAYRTILLPRALLATPNLREAAILADVDPGSVRDVEGMVDLARAVHGLGPTWVLVKGGHLPGVATGPSDVHPPGVPDVLFDGQTVTVLEGARVDTSNTHGTGCTLAAATVAYLARGAGPAEAVTAAKRFVHDALVGARTWRLGRGHGPLDPFGWSP